MTAFLWVMATLGILEVGGALGYFATGCIPDRTPFGVAVNAVVWAGLAAWAVYLIQRQS